MLKFLVFKPNETIEVLLLPYKNTNKYSFVNITKGHICSCVFNSIDEAIEDIEERKKKGLIDRYRRIKYD